MMPMPPPMPGGMGGGPILRQPMQGTLPPPPPAAPTPAPGPTMGGIPPNRGTLHPGPMGGGPIMHEGGPLTNSGVLTPQRPFSHIGNPRATNPISTPML
jgi:hypothetical protein